MATFREIAELSGVSASTVSRVINGNVPVKDSARNKVLSAIKRLEEKESLSKSAGIRGTVGILMPAASAMNLAEHPSLYTTVLSFISIISKHGLGNTTILITGSTDLSVPDVCGFLILGTSEEQEDFLLPKLSDSGKPFIFINRFKGNEHASCVNCDDEQAIELAVEHLISLGHRKIAFIGGNPDFSNTKLRYQSYISTLKSAGIEPDPDFVLYGEYSERSGEELGRQFMQLSHYPTAVCAGSDPIAIGFMRYVSDHGMVLPRDLSVIGFGDIEACTYVNPPLTTIAQNSKELGSVAAAALLQMIENPAICRQQILIRTALVVRGSCMSIA